MPIHDCLETLENLWGGCPDLMDQALPQVEVTFYTDGCSFMHDGVRCAGAAVVNQDQQVEWEQGLPQGTSAQKAELIALTKALELGKGKKINIFTDSHYAFATAHVHGEIYQNRGLLTSEGKTIKNKTEILTLLQAIWLPREVAIIHVHGHQKGASPEVIGNNTADLAAKQAAQKSVGKQMVLLPTAVLLEKPEYTDKKMVKMTKKRWTQGKHGWWTIEYEKVVLPDAVGDTLLQELHGSTHLGKKKNDGHSVTPFHQQGNGTKGPRPSEMMPRLYQGLTPRPLNPSGRDHFPSSW
ncbi:uncharacterized protein LOC110347953 [Heterocephalus glaber]|uniref:Uncharacterized protein LOC110347953 n=1 Tax=Heterocephalus glaber TaxID=10181 RepID=A0AAX6SI48_HETGA|nr:uncharacterized protein LOC110347953 [Heterocephalus glaber]